MMAKPTRKQSRSAGPAGAAVGGDGAAGALGTAGKPLPVKLVLVGTCAAGHD
jgi:hypothetical protein